jgi:hypothetical protein
MLKKVAFACTTLLLIYLPFVAQDAAKAGAMSEIVESCAWTWRRTSDGSIVASNVRFLSNKQIVGYSSKNERAWDIQNGEFVFRGQSGEVLTIFDKAGFRQGKLILAGHYVGGDRTVTELTCDGF